MTPPQEPLRQQSLHGMLDEFADMLGLDRIPMPQLIDVDIRMPRRSLGLPTTPAATPEDQLAREIVAQIEREDGYDGCADARLRGAYDGDAEHRIALAAIKAVRIQGSEG